MTTKTASASSPLLLVCGGSGEDRDESDNLGREGNVQNFGNPSVHPYHDVLCWIPDSQFPATETPALVPEEY